VKKSKLDKRREKTLAAIREQRSLIEAMAQRPRPPEDTFDLKFLEERLQHLSEIEKSAGQATHTDHLDDLISFAEQQGQLRAYICPATEIEREAVLVIDLLEEWAVPKTVIRKLFKLHVEPLKKQVETKLQDAQATLRSLFQEKDSWAEYTEDYEDTMLFHTRRLFAATIILLFLAIGCLCYAFCWAPLLILGLLFSGAVGSCVSVLAKMPLFDVRLSAELEAYGRRILVRTAVGVCASLIGCALLGWGVLPVSLQNQTFTDAMNSSLAAPAVGIKTLILLGVPMLLGFSERALASFEQRVFGNTKAVAKPD